MEEKTLSNHESLEIIGAMISKAKKNVARGGAFYFLMWGGVITMANLAHWILEKFTSYPYPYIVWTIVIPAIIVTIVYSMRQSRDSSTTGYYDHLYGHIWIAVFVGMVITLMFMSKIGFQSNGIILILTGVGTYISGQILRFRPLIVGSILMWTGAVISFTLPVVDQYLVSALSIVVGYLIPGIMLKKLESE